MVVEDTPGLRIVEGIVRTALRGSGEAAYKQVSWVFATVWVL